MLWRAVKSPWRPADLILSQCMSPDLGFTGTRYLPNRLRVRKLHDAAISSREPYPIVRHTRLLDDTEPNTKARDDGPVKITGLVRSVRKQKKIAFARVADGSTLPTIQAVFPDPALAKEYVKMSSKSMGQF